MRYRKNLSHNRLLHFNILCTTEGCVEAGGSETFDEDRSSRRRSWTIMSQRQHQRKEMLYRVQVNCYSWSSYKYGMNLSIVSWNQLRYYTYLTEWALLYGLRIRTTSSPLTRLFHLVWYKSLLVYRRLRRYSSYRRVLNSLNFSDDLLKDRISAPYAEDEFSQNWLWISALSKTILVWAWSFRKQVGVIGITSFELGI